MTVAEVLIALVVALVAFEVVEHVALPLLFALRGRKRAPSTGSEALVGKVGEVKQWTARAGKVFVDGALWRAVGESPLAPGDRAVVRSVEGLTLRVGREARPSSGTARPSRTGRRAATDEEAEEASDGKSDPGV